MSRITYLTNIDFGVGELARLPDVLVSLGRDRHVMQEAAGIDAAERLHRGAWLRDVRSLSDSVDHGGCVLAAEDLLGVEIGGRRANFAICSSESTGTALQPRSTSK